MTQRDHPPGVWRRRAVAVAAYVVIVGCGLWLGQQVPRWIEEEKISHGLMWGTLVAIFVIYVLMTAIPFVPGAEVGLGLMLTLGPGAAPFVYLGMVASLLISFWLGRRVPPVPLALFFRSIGMTRASLRVVQLADLSPEERGEMLTSPHPGGLLGTVLRYRYATLVAVLNIPGNALIGGAGGIGLMAGMCGLYRPVSFALAVALGVLPGPVIFVTAWALMA